MTTLLEKKTLKNPPKYKQIFSYYGSFKNEVKKISWTKRKELWKLTRTVISFMFIFGFVVYFVDIFFRQTLIGVMNMLGKIFG